MYALDNSSGVTTMPVVKNQQFQPNAPRWFTEGGNGVAPSYPGADWFNIVQAELLGVLTEAHITAEKSNLNQLAKAIKEIIANNAPTKKHIHQITEVSGLQDALNKKADASAFTALHDLFIGVPIPYSLATVPAGCLSMNGQRFDKNRYPKLGQKYPSGVLPDLRGEFIRGWDNGRGVDSGRGILSAQLGSPIVQESHSVNNVVSMSGNNLKQIGFDESKLGETPNITVKMTTAEPGNRANNWHAAPGTYSNLGVDIQYMGRTRPRNIAFHYICLAA